MGTLARENPVTAEPTKAGRSALNFWIDLVTALAFTILLATSFIMKFILPPGTCDEVGKVKIWLGHEAIAEALRHERLALDGAPKDIGAFQSWFSLSVFAAAGRDIQTEFAAPIHSTNCAHAVRSKR